MSFDDFYRYFEKIYLCRFIPDSWSEFSVRSGWSLKQHTNGGCTNYGTWFLNPQLAIEVSEDTRCIIVLTQGDARKHGEYSEYTIAIGMNLKAKGEKSTRDFDWGDSVEMTSFVAMRDRVMNVSLKASQSPYKVLPMAFKPSDQTGFKLSVYSEKPVKCKLLGDGTDYPDYPFESHCVSEFTPAKSGGCKNNSTWRNNPQFEIAVREECDVALLLGDSPSGGCGDCLGMYLYDLNGTLLYKSNAFCPTPLIKARLSPKQSPYILLASTFDRGKLGKFIVFGYAMKGISIQPTLQQTHFEE